MDKKKALENILIEIGTVDNSLIIEELYNKEYFKIKEELNNIKGEENQKKYIEKNIITLEGAISYHEKYSKNILGKEGELKKVNKDFEEKKVKLLVKKYIFSLISEGYPADCAKIYKIWYNNIM